MTVTPPAAPPPAAPDALAPRPRRWRGAWRRWAGGAVAVRDFRRLWAGQTVTQVGTQLSQLAIPVLAVQLLAAGEVEMGLLAAAETAAFLVLGLPAGAWVDRWRKRRLMVAMDVVRALAVASLPLAYLLDALTFAHLLLVTLLVGACSLFFDVAYQSILPSLLRRDLLVDGNAKLEISNSAAFVAGPALGGVLLRVLSAPVVLLLDALSYLVSAVVLSRIRTADLAPDRRSRRHLVVEVREGLSFVVRQPLLRRIVACTGLSNFASNISGALLVLYVLRDLGLDAAQLGLAFSLGAVGALVGAVTATGVVRLVGEGRAIPLSALSFVPSAALLPLAGNPLPALPTLVVSGFLSAWSVVVYNVVQVSFRQRLCPPALLGRMNATVRFFVWGTMPLGALAGGALGHWLGIRPALWIAAAGIAVSTLPVALSPLWRMRDLPSELDETASGEPPAPAGG